MLGNFLLKRYYNWKVEKTVLECSKYAMERKIKDITALSEIAYDLTLVIYVWAMPNARAVYKRKRGIQGLGTLAKGTYRFFVSKSERGYDNSLSGWMMSIQDEVETAYDLVSWMIKNSLMRFFATCQELEIIEAKHLDELNNTFLKDELDDYRDLVFKNHRLGDHSLIRLLALQPDLILEHLNNKYSGYAIMGGLTAHEIESALEDHDV